MRKSSLMVVVSAVTVGLLMGACSNNSSNDVSGPSNDTTDTATVWQGNDGSWYSMINATSYDSYAYFSLQNREIVALTDEEASASSDWDIAFSRINGKLNGGVSGPGGMVGVDLADIGDPDSTDFEAVTTAPQVPSDAWESDQENLAVSNWYVYLPEQGHILLPTHDLYVMVTAQGDYAKFNVDTLYGGGMPPDMGTVEITYVFQPNGSTDLSGDPQTAVLDIGASTGYFSFAKGGLIDVADPSTSTAWDLEFQGYECRINGGNSGPGNASVYPMYLETNDFASVSTAPQGGGYFPDAIQSIFGAPNIPGSEWYNYDETVHVIETRGHVYILKAADGTLWKLAITGYYRVVDEIPISGWITVRFDALTN